ncbi:hypothetical protein HUJ05_001526 [Dendroctonus ponderosae]|nr:hypothetical protein HUJ05_001526 [Dendroctonus ponderosae]
MNGGVYFWTLNIFNVYLHMKLDDDLIQLLLNILTMLDLNRRNITSHISEKQLSNNSKEGRTQRRQSSSSTRLTDVEKDLREEEVPVPEVKDVPETSQQLTPKNPTTEVSEPHNFDTPLETQQKISEIDPDSGGQANALLKHMEEFNFHNVKYCQRSFSSSSVTYEVVKSVKKNRTLEVLQSFRTDYFFTKFFNQCTEIANKCGFKAAELPRKGKLLSKIGGGSKAPFESVEQYYKVSIL